jgi:phage shock protein PspC (stress-responsive transcriptional regulator)
MTAPVPSPRLRRSRSDAVLGGVCAGVARSAGLDPLLLRVAVVAVTVLTGGAGLIAYLAAWVLIPRDTDGSPAPQQSAAAESAPDVRTAWTTVGDDLRTLATDLRRPPTDAAAPAEDAVPESAVPEGAVPPPRSPISAADDAATALGERLRDPQVQAGARKAAASVSQALNASVDEVGRRIRRDPG